MLAIQIWVNLRLTQSVQVQGRTKAPDGRGCCWKLVDHSHHPTSNPLFLTLLEFSQPTLRGYYRKTNAGTVLLTRYYSSISWEWDQHVFHVEGKRKRQQRWSFLLALWTTNCSSESILLFILPRWKPYCQLKTYNFSRVKPQENKCSATSSSHISNSKWIPFLHGCH